MVMEEGRRAEMNIRVASLATTQTSPRKVILGAGRFAGKFQGIFKIDES